MTSTEQETKLIRGHGVSNPTVIFIIDHPQGDDYKSGYALSGASGNTVRGLLKDVGLYFDQYYHTSLIKTEPAVTLDSCKGQGGGTKEYLKQNTNLVKEQSHFIVDEINTLKPNLLVPLGELSFNFLSGLEGIRKFRGSILQTSPLLSDPAVKILNQTYKILPALGPYPYLNQDYKMRMITKLDFSRINLYANDSQPPESTIRVWVAKSAGEFRNFLERSYNVNGFLTFDIETFLQIPTCISFCFDSIESCCVPLIDKSIDRDNLALLWMLVGKILASPIRKGNQNIKYDWKILQRWGFTVNNVCEDTMLAAGCIYPEFPKNLGFLTSIYTELPYFKDEGKDFDPTIHKREQIYLYNAKDSLAARRICEKQNEELIELNTKSVYDNLIRCLPIYKRMEERGIRIDCEKRDQLLAKYSSLFEIECIKIRSLTGNSTLNPLSSVQMNKLVFTELGYETGRYVKGTDEESLEWLLVEGEHRSYIAKDILKCITNCRKLHKVIEILELELHPDKRFRYEANLVGTETGRSTGGKTTDQLIIIPEKGKIKLKNLGHSLQTIGKHGFSIDGITYGKDIRNMYVPSRGHSFVEIDLSGAEARVDRVLSGNFDMEVFDNPGIHKLTGSWLYNCLPSDIKKNILVNGEDQYHTAKTVRHAGERNMREDRLVMMIQRPRERCKELLNKFHSEAPEIRAVYHRDIINAINETRCLIMPNNRRRDFFDRINHDTYNEGFSVYPQAIVSDQTKFEGIIPTAEKFLWAELLVEQHDGTLWEVPCGREYELWEEYKKNIEKPIDFRQGSIKRDYELVIPAELSIGEHWGDMKEIKTK